MRRFALETLANWKANLNHKPMIIHGIRQVGKTWLMKEFGRNYYENTAYILFEKNPRMNDLFSQGTDINRILTGLELETGKKIEAHNTLIIFDDWNANTTKREDPYAKR